MSFGGQRIGPHTQQCLQDYITHDTEVTLDHTVSSL